MSRNKVSHQDVQELVKKGLIPADSPDAFGDLAPLVERVVNTGFPHPTPEFVFAPPRKFAFDLAWPEFKVAFEREGGKFTTVRCVCGQTKRVFVSRHHSKVGLEIDLVKYNLAATMSWIVLRGTPGLIAEGAVIDQVVFALSSRRGLK